MTFRKPWFKDFKIWIGIIAVLAIFGAFLPDPHKAEKDFAEKLKKDSLSIVNGDIKHTVQYVGTYGLNEGIKTILVVSDSITEHQAIVLSKHMRDNETENTLPQVNGSYKVYHKYLYQIKTYDTNNISDYNVELEGLDVRVNQGIFKR